MTEPKPRVSYRDLFAGAAMLVGLILVVAFDAHPAIRFPVSLICIAVVPGYALVAVLFPQQPSPSLSISERLAVSVGLSLAVALISVVASTVVLQSLEFDLPFQILVVATAMLLGGAAWRRRDQNPSDRRTPAFAAPSWRQVMIVLAVGAAGALTVLGVMDHYAQPPATTEMWFVGPNGSQFAHVDVAARGSNQSLEIAVLNRERVERTYRLETVWFDSNGTDLGEITPALEFHLVDQAKVIHNLEFSVPVDAGYAEFRLFKAESRTAPIVLLLNYSGGAVT